MDGDLDYEKWSVDKLKDTLKQNQISDHVITVLSDNSIAGRHLKKLTATTFREMSLSLGDWLDFKDFMEKEEKKKGIFFGNPKIFNDPIHGNIRLSSVCLAIIDTPQFQRLRYLKQLGLVYFVYPGAAHNRFEHSLGVCFLAGEYVRTLKENQPYLGITEQDILCVEIAALCHDLGHGPFSHTFDQMFIPAVIPERKWTHEDASKDMFDHLVRVNELNKEGGIFEKHGLSKIDMTFIKELIAPHTPKNGAWPHRGRTKEKAYLYEIVANKRNSIDVDKWDYMARDCHQLGIRNNFDHTRFIQFARVIEMDGEVQICLRDKEVLNLYNMFSTRYTLHKVAYQHQVASAMSLMVAHALIKANKYILINGKDGKKCKISECIDDMAAYTYLTDDIIFKILDIESEEEDLKSAKDLIRRLFSRDLYKCVYQSKPIDPTKLLEMSDTKIKQDIMQISNDQFSEDDIFVQVVRLGFGMNDMNPVEKLHVYSKNNKDEARVFQKEETSRIVASNYIESLVRVYCCERRKDKSKDKTSCENKFKEISAACKTWFSNTFPVAKKEKLTQC